MRVQRWDVWEITVNGPKEGNPFVEQSFEGTFVGKNETVKTAGFYDGDGIYKVRFMPSFEGEYTYTTSGLSSTSASPPWSRSCWTWA